MRFHLRPAGVLVCLLVIISILVSFSLLGTWFEFGLGRHYVYRFVPTFNLNRESNVPAFFSALLLFSVFVLSGMIAVSERRGGVRDWIYWFALSCGFLYMSIDEISVIHEAIRSEAAEFFNASGVFYYAWIIPYGIAVIVLALIFSRFILRLPANVRALFIVSGMIYLIGAIGFEMLGGLHHETYGKETVTYALLYTAEETLEMLGVALFIYALLKHIAVNLHGATVAIEPK